MAERSLSLSSSSRQQRTIRCAVYTRKSSEEGLEQDFNSLHAQREACEAYITSQRHEGWKLLPARYDDGGYSGGSMERPGLQKLLADMQSGLIDVVVVYKVDRLTRSLTDFARIVEAFDARNASFVSVTQSFNTTTSMGRLTLNVLLSFAQFEREVTGERIRDKIAASKKKGMWMGGFVPMGYAANGRSLTIVESEAAVIRRIFDRFLALGSVRDLKAELDRDGITTRPFVSASNNRSWGNRPFSIGHLRSILQNPIYIGEVRHKDERYPAQHPAIIERQQFDRVQALISSRARKHRMRIGAEHINLLSGLLFDKQGQKFASAHSSKQGIRYRYYVSIDRSSPSAPPQRIPAGDLERLVLESITAKLKDPSWLRANVATADATPNTIGETVTGANDIAGHIASHDNRIVDRHLREIVSRIEISPDTLAIQLNVRRLVPTDKWDDERNGASLTIEIPYPFGGKHQSRHLVVRPDGGQNRAPSKWLVKAIARSVTWYDDLASGRATSLCEIARREGVDERFVAKLIPLAFLAPRLVSECLEGRQMLSLTASHLALSVDLPLAWADQRT
jgi:site-specific DNA recombinase